MRGTLPTPKTFPNLYANDLKGNDLRELISPIGNDEGASPD